MLKAAMDELELDYFEAEGEAAFYGPKLDVQVKTALGNEKPCQQFNWISYCQNALNLNMLVLMVKVTVQSWFTVVSSQPWSVSSPT
jgi:hypothetical protein